MAKDKEINNVAILGNAAHLVSEIILNVAGNEISNHLNGKQINPETVNGLALATFNKQLSGAEQ